MEAVETQSFPLPLEIALALVKSPEQIEKFCRELVERGMHGDFSSPLAEYMLKMSKDKYDGMIVLHKIVMDAPVPGDFSSTFQTLPPHGNESRQRRGIVNPKDWENYKISDFARGLAEDLGLMIVDEFKGNQNALTEIGLAWAEHENSQILGRVIELTEDENLLRNGLGYNADLDFSTLNPDGDIFKSMQIEMPQIILKIQKRLQELKIKSIGMNTRKNVAHTITGSN